MEDEKKVALAEFLGCDPSEITDIGSGGFTRGSEEYRVFTDEEADSAFEDFERASWDDTGLEGFSKWFQDWIVENCIEPDAFWEDMNGMNSSYCSDIAQEDDPQFGNRLVQECYDRELIGDGDFEKGEDGEPDYTNCIYDTDELIEKMTEDMNSDYSNSVDYMIDQFGVEELSKTIKENPDLVDFDKVLENIKTNDGRGALAPWDATEQEQNGFYIYRMN